MKNIVNLMVLLKKKKSLSEKLHEENIPEFFLDRERESEEKKE